jgi:hypothetical protein
MKPNTIVTVVCPSASSTRDAPGDAGSPSERARASVTRAVRFAMVRIREHEPQLAEHLDRSIRTGTYCAYLPDPRAPVAWKL